MLQESDTDRRSCLRGSLESPQPGHRVPAHIDAGCGEKFTGAGTCPDLFERYGREAGLYEDLSPTLERGAGGKFRTFHNYMKDTPEFQQNSDNDQTFRFEPFSAWLVLTDVVSHASVSGQHALVYTGLLPLKDCRCPELAPFNILRAAAQVSADTRLRADRSP